MAELFLVHWHAAEAAEKAARLEAAGHRVRYGWEQCGQPARAVRAELPELVLIDLARLPSHGREMAQWVRSTKATAGVGVIFLEGADEAKNERARRDFPEFEVASWRGVRGAVKRALAQRARGGRRAGPAPSASGYSGTPLPKKLGLKAGGRLALLGAPDDFEATLGPLPEGVSVRRQARGPVDVIVLFVRRAAELERRFPAAQRALAEGGGLWVAWPKQSSGVVSDLSQAAVQAVGLDAGLVDNKICAIDATWSGQRFMRRRVR